MNAQSKTRKLSTSRREFLRQTSGALAGAAIAGAIGTRAYSAEQNTIRIALVGCGGRGTGAAVNALSTKGPTQLLAMADVFDNRLQNSLKSLSKQFPRQLDVPRDKQLLGLDAYKKAIDAIAPGGLVILATPPAFRPIHLEYAVANPQHRRLLLVQERLAGIGPGSGRTTST